MVKRLDKVKGKKGRKLLLLQNWTILEGEGSRKVIAQMLHSLQSILPLSEEEQFNFKVVVSELVNNEFRHGLGSNVHVSVSAFSDAQIELCVYGAQKDFNLDYELKSQKRKDAAVMESGRGLMLAEALCESLRMDCTCDGNIVRARMQMNGGNLN